MPISSRSELSNLRLSTAATNTTPPPSLTPSAASATSTPSPDDAPASAFSQDALVGSAGDAQAYERIRRAKMEMDALDFSTPGALLPIHVPNTPQGLSVVNLNGMYFEIDQHQFAGSSASADGSKIRLGKHLHYSPIGGKLCTYSSRQCMQKRLDGYGFCIKHILEDPTAPWKQCSYISGVTGKRCTNPIPLSETVACCTMHLQILGLASKRTSTENPLSTLPQTRRKRRMQDEAGDGEDEKLPESQSSQAASDTDSHPSQSQSDAASSKLMAAAPAIPLPSPATGAAAAAASARAITPTLASTQNKDLAAANPAALSSPQRKRLRFMQALTSAGIPEDSVKAARHRQQLSNSSQRKPVSIFDTANASAATQSLLASLDASSGDESEDVDSDWFSEGEDPEPWEARSAHGGPSSSSAAAAGGSHHLPEPLQLQEDFSQTFALRNSEFLTEEELVQYRLQSMQKLRGLYKSQFDRLRDVLEKKCTRLVTAADNVIALRLSALPAGSVASITPEMSNEALSTACVVDGETITPILAVTDREIMVKHHRAEVDRHEWLASISKSAVRAHHKRAGGSGAVAAQDGRRCGATVAAPSMLDDAAAQTCGKAPLPLSSYCHAHILQDPLQVLFKRCQYKDNRLTDPQNQPVLCQNPVVVHQQPPFCEHHLRVHAYPQLAARKEEALAAAAALAASAARVVVPMKKTKDGKRRSTSTSSALQPSSVADSPLQFSSPMTPSVMSEESASLPDSSSGAAPMDGL